MSAVVASEENKREVSFWKASSSFMGTRLFFLLLLGLDAAWFVFLLMKMFVFSFLQLLYLGSSSTLKIRLLKTCVGTRRCIVCGLCLLVGFFSPSFGVMIGCTYFMMRDKQGVEECVPKTLKEQVGEFLSLKIQEEKSQF